MNGWDYLGWGVVCLAGWVGMVLFIWCLCVAAGRMDEGMDEGEVPQQRYVACNKPKETLPCNVSTKGGDG